MKHFYSILLALLLTCSPVYSAVELDSDANGAVDIAKGGTNATTAADARTALLVPTITATLVGNCTAGPCLDGTSDGGSAIRLYGANTFYTALQAGTSIANRTWTLPTAAAPSAGTTRLMNMDENGAMGFVDPATFAASTSASLTTPVIVDGSTLTFNESAADPNDADVQLSATDGVLKLASVNGANNEDLTLDLDATTNKAKLSSSTGVVHVSTGVIPFTSAKMVVAKATNYTIGTDDPDEAYGGMFFNTAASTRTFTLPSAVAGMSVCVKNAQGVAQSILLDASAGDYIVMSTGARTTAAAEYYGSTASAANMVCVVAYDATDWHVIQQVGTWTEE